MNPQRGEVWLVDLGMVAKTRPALIISQQIEDRDRALVTIIPHTTSVRGTRFEVAQAVPFLKPGAFDTQQLVTIPTAKVVKRLGLLGANQLSQVEHRLREWLVLP